MGAFDYAATERKRVVFVNKDTTLPKMLYALQNVKALQLSPGVNTWKTFLSVSGGGTVNFAACVISGATADTLKFRVTVDGSVIYSASGAVSVVNMGFIGVGSTGYDSTNSVSVPVFQRIAFEKSLLIEVMNTTAQATTCYIDYEVNA